MVVKKVATKAVLKVARTVEKLVDKRVACLVS